MRKIIIFFLLLCFLAPLPLLAQRDLEVDYPEVQGERPETTEFSLSGYAKYIYYFSLSFAGLAALLVLLWAGIRRLTAGGNPAAVNSSKKWATSAFVGLLLLFLSYLILVTINPELTILSLPELSTNPPEDLPNSPISSLISQDLLQRIKELAETITPIPDKINEIAQTIQSLTENCECENTLPLCMCTGGQGGDSCQPRYCYAGPNAHPCPDFEEIRSNQAELLLWGSELSYYKLRLLAEEEDLRENIDKVLDVKISWYNEKIDQEENPEIKPLLEEERDWLIQEKNYKEDLINKLTELAAVIEETPPFIETLSELPEECLANVKEKCEASCTGACHDIKTGCQPEACSGGNPCPIDGISKQVDEISSYPGQIQSLCNEIISIIEGIDKIKERTIQLY